MCVSVCIYGVCIFLPLELAGTILCLLACYVSQISARHGFCLLTALSGEPTTLPKTHSFLLKELNGYINTENTCDAKYSNLISGKLGNKIINKTLYQTIFILNLLDFSALLRISIVSPLISMVMDIKNLHLYWKIMLGRIRN